MGFHTGAYCSVWSVEPGKGNFSKVRLSISRKNKDGQFEQDFSGYCTFIAQAHAKASSLKERDRIKLGDIDVSTTYDKEKQKEYVNFKVFNFEMANFPNDNAQPAAPVAADTPVDGDADDEIPF